MSFWKKIRERIWLHHTENDVLNIIIIQGKDHNHLVIKIRNIEEVLEKEYTSKEELIKDINKFLEYFSKNIIDYETDKEELKKLYSSEDKL